MTSLLSNSSAEQPAKAVMNSTLTQYLDGCAMTQFSGCDGLRKLVFYNIGWQFTSKTHTKERLSAEILSFVASKCADAIGII